MKLIKLFMMACLFIATSVFAQVNINTASADELSALKGIGVKKAAAIIKYRKANGKFKSVEELVNVPGIGEKMLKNLGSDVKVTGKTDLTKLKNKKATTKKKSVKKKTADEKVTGKKSTKKKTSEKKVTDKKSVEKQPTDKKAKTEKTKSSTKSKTKTKAKKVKKAKKSKKTDNKENQ